MLRAPARRARGGQRPRFPACGRPEPDPGLGRVGLVGKARLSRLKAHEQYWYRFSTRGAESPVGRFRTALPPDSREPVRFAFFSCQEYSIGFYNAHVLLAGEDLDFVLSLGDYIYADGPFPSGGPFVTVRADPVGYAETTEQYRGKYALYRSDPSLRGVHSRFPLVSIWDDHEVVDNYAGGAGPTGGLPLERRYTEARRAAAYRAYFQSMPTSGAKRGSKRIYRTLRFGRTVDLILLDQRQYRADQPCEDGWTGPSCAELERPRTLLGRRQMGYVKRRPSSSQAAWKVLANQTIVMPWRLPGGVLLGFDSWQGYPRERRQLLEHVRRNEVEDMVFLTGDTHTFIAGEVRVDDKDRKPVATEFAGGSITSPAPGEGLGSGIIDQLKSANDWAARADFEHHGYTVVEASQSALKCTLRRVATVKSRSREPLRDKRYRVERGQPELLR